MAKTATKHDHPFLRFFFDVAAWRGSRAVQRMTFAERGVYFEMLLEQWEKRNLPDSPEAVADAIASSDGQAAEVLAAWDVVRRKFLPSRGDPTRIYNAALERTRRIQREYKRHKQDAGARGGKAKSVNHTKEKELEASKTVAVLADAVAKPSDLKRVEESRREESRGESTALAPRSSKEPPMSMNLRRLKVWRWMLEQWIARLGDHAEAFDLDAWLHWLDVQPLGVLPAQGDQWFPFLDAKFSEEVRRRGLPVATMVQLGKTNTRLASALANIEAEAAR